MDTAGFFEFSVHT